VLRIRRLEPNDQALYCQMSRAIASGNIMRIRRGFYTLNKIFRTASINEHIVAKLFVPESYISFETALWDAGWVPEFVYEIASVSLKPSFEIKPPFAVFSYTRIPQKNMAQALILNVSAIGENLDVRLSDVLGLFNAYIVGRIDLFYRDKVLLILFIFANLLGKSCLRRNAQNRYPCRPLVIELFRNFSF
jgi:hypothetical protein